jgi:RNA polymerase sigma-70 factor (ECF subfamily)
MTPAQRLEVLMERQDAFRRFLVRRTRTRDDAEDLLQEALLKATAKVHTVRDDDAVVPWFYRVLRNALADHGAKLAAHAAGLEAASGAVESAAMPIYERPGCACSISMLDALPPQYAELLRRVDIEQEPVETFAEREGVTSNSATVRLHRARKALRAQLADFCGTTSVEECLNCACATEAPSARPSQPAV